MRRAREIVGLPVLELDSGGQVGWVQDVVFDDRKNQVIGVLLEGGHLFHSNKGIPRRDIVAVGKDALTIQTKRLEELTGTLWSQKVGNRIFTHSGDARGTIEDVFLDDMAMNVVGFEVSDGLFSDLLHGRGTILQQHVLVDGKDVLIVDDQVFPLDDKNKGGSLS